MWHWNGSPSLVGLVQDGEGRTSGLVRRLLLSDSQGSSDVPLAEWATATGAEDEVRRLWESGLKLVASEY